MRNLIEMNCFKGKDKTKPTATGLDWNFLESPDYCPEVTTANKQKGRKSEKEGGGREGDAMQYFWLVRPSASARCSLSIFPRYIELYDDYNTDLIRR